MRVVRSRGLRRRRRVTIYLVAPVVVAALSTAVLTLIAGRLLQSAESFTKHGQEAVRLTSATVSASKEALREAREAREVLDELEPLVASHHRIFILLPVVLDEMSRLRGEMLLLQQPVQGQVKGRSLSQLLEIRKYENGSTRSHYRPP